MTINVPLLRKELEYVTAHRDQWYQPEWLTRSVCGTTGCLAGNAVLNAGYRPDWNYESSIHQTDTAVVVDVESGERRDVLDVATRLFGLDDDDADWLFHPQSSLLQLWVTASHLTEGAIEVPPELLVEFSEEARACGLA